MKLLENMIKYCIYSGLRARYPYIYSKNADSSTAVIEIVDTVDRSVSATADGDKIMGV